MSQIPKRIRFEVFKRDKFTCQYCGRAAPDVVLHCDHVNPRAGGGEDDILNLVTACVDCNLGKADKTLSDGSAIAKKRTQLELLQERREQLDMMMDWQQSLSDIDETTIDRCAEFWSELSGGWTLTEHGKRNLRRSIKKFGLSEVLSSMRIAAESYLEYDGADGVRATPESCEIALKKIRGICSVREAEKEKPWLRDLLYIRGILRNRLAYVNENECRRWLESAFSWGADAERLKDIARSASSWTNWWHEMSDYIVALSGREPSE